VLLKPQLKSDLIILSLRLEHFCSAILYTWGMHVVCVWGIHIHIQYMVHIFILDFQSGLLELDMFYRQ